MDGGKYEEAASVVSDVTHGTDRHGTTIMNTLDFSRIEEMDPSTGACAWYSSCRVSCVCLVQQGGVRVSCVCVGSSVVDAAHAPTRACGGCHAIQLGQ